MEPIYIFGHKNPDTDSVCGAISLSYLKNRLGILAEARVLGDINKETEFALKKFGIDVPLYLNDVKVTLKDVKFHKNYLINEDAPIIDAFNIMNKSGITGIPLVNSKKEFKGYVSLKEIASDMIYNENTFVDTPFLNIVNTLEANDYLKFDDHITGYAHAATFSDDTFLKRNIDEETIVIVGDRDELIEKVILKHVKLIILVKNTKLSSRLKKLAEENRVNIICTSKSSFKIARVLCLSNPIKSIKRGTTTITFNDMDYLTDFYDATSRLKHTNYPIINNKNICLGMLRTIDAHEVKRKKVILVDHNTTSQTVDGLYEAEILEVIDHHNIGDINTSIPINFRNMSVGSVNTIIYYLYQESNVKIPKKIAGIMLSGIISDTLLLQSPTTTSKDILVANELAKIAKVDLQEYGLELLSSGVSIDSLNANQIIFKDFKTYKASESTFGIGQVFTTDFKIFKPRIKELVEELNNLDKHNDFKCCCLFVTNFLTNNSYIIYSDSSKKVIENAYGISNLEQGYLLKGIVSRKKQMVPNIMDIVEHM